MTSGIRSIQLDNWTLELLPPASYEVSYTPEQPIIGYAFERQTGTHSFASDKKIDFQAVPNGLAWVPKGCDVYSMSSGGEYLKITCSSLTHQNPDLMRPFSDAIVPAAIEAAFTLRRALLTDTIIDPLAIECQLMTMESSVLRVAGARSNDNSSSGWMDALRLKKIDEFIAENLGTQLTVSQVASEAGISAGFLSREFKSAVGRTPHQYIVDKRLSQTRMQLQHSRQDLSAIAFACGFSSHSHMTALFKKHFGRTPDQLRKNR